MIRKAIVDDYFLVNQIEQDSCLSDINNISTGFILNAFSKEEFEYFVTNNMTWVYELDGKVIAFAVMGNSDNSYFEYIRERWSLISWDVLKERKFIDVSWIERIVIKDIYRGKSIGKEFLKFLINTSIHKQILTAIVHQPTDNYFAFDFYSKMGFNVIGNYSSPSFRNYSDYKSRILEYVRF